jgi:SpoVK/Ycf46/Vps4 family AAA+-type ATPase
VARSDLVKALLRSYSNGDDRAFRDAADEVIADERRKRHDVLADQLEAILVEPARSRPLHVSSLRPLPKGRENSDLLSIRQPRASLHDVVLDENADSVVRSVLDEFRQRSALRAHGLTPRSNLLFVGPPGCGKSLTAEALAGELGVAIARVELAAVVSSYLGETAKNLEQIFSFVRTGSWVLLFDEFDMLARERGDQTDHGELKRVVAVLLQLIEDASTDSIIVATTNHASLLDVALWRRFDEVVGFDAPDQRHRERLLELKLRGARSDVDLGGIAQRLDGFTHAEIEAVCQDAMRLMVLRLDRVLGRDHFDYAIERHEQRRRTIEGARS